MNKVGVKYAVVADYVAILFGRSRRSDDIDFIASIEGEEGFLNLCSELREAGFSVMQGDISSEDSLRKLFRHYLQQRHSIRFMLNDIILPNIEFKLATTKYHLYSINNSYEVVVNDEHELKIAPLELQIAYKLYLGSDKDIGDAVFLYTLFKQVLDYGELERWCEELNVDINLLGAE